MKNTTSESKSRKPMLWLLMGSAITSLAIMGVWLSPSQSAQAEAIKVYKSATCGCCKKWISHLESNGFEVDAEDRKDLPSIKQELGIAQNQQSCHTAKIGGYFIEGHVPASDIERLLAEKPDIAGLAVPGMPVGSPGMEVPGRKADSYKVYAVDKQGNTRVFSSY